MLHRAKSSLGLLAAALTIAGCATSRLDQLRDKADRVESHLLKERDRIARLPSGDPERSPRLDHLTTLRTTLSAANIGLGTVPHFVPHDKRDLAYDVIDEAYDTIDWNIPLGPNDPKKPLPFRFQNGTLNLDSETIAR
jgi:hypothetical protein